MCIYFNICITYKKVFIIIRDSNVYLFYLKFEHYKKKYNFDEMNLLQKDNLLQGRTSYMTEKISNFYMLFKLRKGV